MQFEQLQGKRVFITGAASGIGLAQAKAFLANGASVFTLDVQDSRLIHERLQHFIGNVSDQQLVQQVVAQMGDIDILCNTAGVLGGYAKSLDTDEALWGHVMNTNVKGTYFVTNAVLSGMLARKSGVIVNMASIAGLVASGGGVAYTASKHAIIGYTKQLSNDEKQLGTAGIIEAAKQMGGVVIAAAVILGGTFAALYPSGILTLIQVSTAVIMGLVMLACLVMPIIIPVCIRLAEKFKHFSWKKEK